MDLLIKKHMKILFHRQINEQRQLDFIKQLHRLLSNGYSLIDALEMFQWDKQLNKISKRIKDYLLAGDPIDKAFAKEHFHHSITAYLYFSQVHGDLIKSLEKCMTMLEHRLKAMNKFHQVLRYPIILSVFFFGLLIIIKHHVFPSFVSLYESQGNVSSILNISMLVIDIFLMGIIISFVLLIVGTILWFWIKRHLTIQQLKRFYQSLPIIRSYMTLKTSYQLAVHLSSLLKTDLTPIEILKIIAAQNELPIIADTAKQAIEQLLDGVQLSEAFHPFILIDEQFSFILRKNSNMDALKADLAIYVEIVQERIHDNVMKAINVIQPLFLIVIASFIVFLYGSLMWPMFQLIQTI